MSSRRYRLGQALAAGASFVLILPAAALAAIVTTQSGTSQIELAGATVQDVSDAQTDGRVSVFAIQGSPTTAEARTAARAGAHEIAANAKIDDKALYSLTDWTLVLSQANYDIHVSADNAFVRRAALDFALPKSYLEITSNAEFASNVLQAALIADLRVCFAVACTGSDSVFHVQANLEASFNSYSWSSVPTGDPTLDLTPYTNPTVTDTGRTDPNTGDLNFLRTVNVGFDAFQGHLDLGSIPADSPLTVEYLLQTRVWGRGVTNVAIAAINDPFLLGTDPVQAGDPASLTLTAVPAPASGLLLLTGFVFASLRKPMAQRKP